MPESLVLPQQEITSGREASSSPRRRDRLAGRALRKQGRGSDAGSSSPSRVQTSESPRSTVPGETKKKNKNVQLARNRSDTAKRQRVAQAYDKRLRGQPNLALAMRDVPGRRISGVYVVRWLDAQSRSSRTHREGLHSREGIAAAGTLRLSIWSRPTRQRVCRTAGISRSTASARSAVCASLFKQPRQRRH